MIIGSQSSSNMTIVILFTVIHSRYFNLFKNSWYDSDDQPRRTWSENLSFVTVININLMWPGTEGLEG